MTRFPRILGRRRFAVLIALFSLNLARGLFYSILIPPWQAPDEPRHVEYAVQLAGKRWLLGGADSSPDLQRQILRSMKEFDFWRYVGREEPETVPESFFDDPLLKRSGTRFGDESPLYYLIPAFLFTLTGAQDVLVQLYLMRWFSVLLGSATVVVSYLVAEDLFPEDLFMIIAISTFITFLPMFTFIGASANNDILAVLAVSLLLWQVVRVVRSGISWPSLLLICGLTLLSVLAKKTALFTVPLVVVAIPISLWGRPRHLREGHKCFIGTCCVLMTLLLAVMFTWRGRDAADWVELPEPSADTRSHSLALSGSHSLHLGDGRLMQPLPFNTVRELRGKTVTLEVWLKATGGNRRGSLLVADSDVRTLEIFKATETWMRRTITHTVSAHAKSLRVVLSSGARSAERTGDLYFDDVILLEIGDEGSNLLRNGSAEVAALRVRPRLEGLTRYVSLRHLLDPRSYDAPSLGRYLLYSLLTFAGFWANFGWLMLPLDPMWYLLLAVVTLASAGGLTLWGAKLFRQLRKDREGALDGRTRSLLLFLVGFCLAILQIVLPMIGRQWQPQGRYLFPALIIIATLFALGLRQLMPKIRPSILLAAYLAGFLLFDLICIVRYIFPHYYS